MTFLVFFQFLDKKLPYILWTECLLAYDKIKLILQGAGQRVEGENMCLPLWAWRARATAQEDAGKHWERERERGIRIIDVSAGDLERKEQFSTTSVYMSQQRVFFSGHGTNKVFLTQHSLRPICINSCRLQQSNSVWLRGELQHIST